MLAPTSTFKKSFVKFKDTGLLSTLISDYLSGDQKARGFYQYEHNMAAFGEVIKNRKQFPVYRTQLAAAVRNQSHLLLKDFPLVNDNISLLEKENTFTVTTGHQLCIFTGPLYYIYKIISTINLAEALRKQYPDYNFIPVYWLSGEDHDFAEINHIHLFNRKFEWTQELGGAAGRISTDSMTVILAELKEVMGSAEHAEELYRLFEEAYLFNATLGDATRFLITHLFGKYGLVVVDGDDHELKKIYLPVLRDELENQISVKNVEETSVSLTQAGYKVQVHPREINLFYLGDGLRERIIKRADGRFEVMNTSLVFNHDEFMALLELNPERFSPNVVLRPLYQEYILPNLAYVGGPGELSYWLQYKSMFKAHHVHYPLLMLRSSVVLMDAKSMRRLEALKMSMTDLFRKPDELSALFISKQEESKFDFEKEKELLRQAFDSLKNKITAIDKSLEGTVAAEYQKTLNALEVLHKKTTAASKRKHEVAITQLKNLREKLFPDGVFQERYLNFIPWYLQYGESFIDILRDQLPVGSDTVVIMEETG